MKPVNNFINSDVSLECDRIENHTFIIILFHISFTFVIFLLFEESCQKEKRKLKRNYFCEKFQPISFKILDFTELMFILIMEKSNGHWSLNCPKRTTVNRVLKTAVNPVAWYTRSYGTLNYMFARMENVFSNIWSLITISETICRRNTCEKYNTDLTCINRIMANIISQSPTHNGCLYTVTEIIGHLRNSLTFFKSVCNFCRHFVSFLWKNEN